MSEAEPASRPSHSSAASANATTPRQTAAGARRARRADWHSHHQPYELEFHREDNFRWHDESFMAQWDLVFGELCGFNAQSFGSDNVLLDLGCGSRPALDWFASGPRKLHLDPLLDQYREIPQVTQYWQQKQSSDLIASPAEEFVSTLEGCCDFVLCWNVLDHTFDWREILLNAWRYVQPGGIVCIGTDIEAHGPGHPGIDDPHEFGRFLGQRFNVLERRVEFLHRELALVLQKPTEPAR